MSIVGGILSLMVGVHVYASQVIQHKVSVQQAPNFSVKVIDDSKSLMAKCIVHIKAKGNITILESIKGEFNSYEIKNGDELIRYENVEGSTYSVIDGPYIYTFSAC